MTDETTRPPSSPQTGPSNDQAAGPHRSLESVLASGRESLRLTFDLVSGSDLDFDALDDAVTWVGSRLGTVDEKSDRSEVSLEIAAMTAKAQEHESRAELDAWVDSVELWKPSASMAVAEGEALIEHVSILLHALEVAADESRPAWIRAIDDALCDMPRDDIAPLMLPALRDAAASMPHAQFDTWLDPLLPIVRVCVDDMCTELSRYAIEGTPHAREALWPFIVDEFLSSLKGRTQGLDDRVHSIDPVALERAIARLCERPSIARSRAAAGMFSLEQTFVYPLLHRLMESPARKAIGPLILGAFRESLPADPGVAFCVFALRRYTDSLGWLVAEQLRNPAGFVSSDAQRSAAWMLVSVLESLAADRRGELWIPGAIEWLGQRNPDGDSPVQTQGTKQLIRRVLTERDGLRRVWSKECRNAAKKARSFRGFR